MRLSRVLSLSGAREISHRRRQLVGQTQGACLRLLVQVGRLGLCT